jgi:hypothetical protein
MSPLTRTITARIACFISANENNLGSSEKFVGKYVQAGTASGNARVLHPERWRSVKGETI